MAAVLALVPAHDRSVTLPVSLAKDARGRALAGVDRTTDAICDALPHGHGSWISSLMRFSASLSTLSHYTAARNIAAAARADSAGTSAHTAHTVVIQEASVPA